MTVSPSRVAQVCEGDQLVLNCISSESTHRWSFGIINPSQPNLFIQEMFSSTMGSDMLQPPLTVNSTTFSVRRTSTANDAPLVSLLTIENVTPYLHMTEVNCSTQRQNGIVQTSTFIHVILLKEYQSESMLLSTSIASSMHECIYTEY